MRKLYNRILWSVLTRLYLHSAVDSSCYWYDRLSWGNRNVDDFESTPLDEFEF